MQVAQTFTKGSLFFIFLSLLLNNAFAQQIKPTNYFQAEALINRIEKRGFDFFWNEHYGPYDFIPDSAWFYGGNPSNHYSIAGIGMGITAICIGESRGWISEQEAYTRIHSLLYPFANGLAANENGYFYHFLNQTGQAYPGSEVSSVDHALLVAGALFAGQYFPGTDIETMARQIYENTNWAWMWNGTHMWMSWKDGVFGPDSWNRYSEGLLLLLLAIHAPNNPIPADAHIVWNAWNRNFLDYDPGSVYNNFPVYMHIGALFAHQFPQLWLDFRGKEANDGYYYWEENYFKNSVIASLINRNYCAALHNLDPSNYNDYNLNCWGLSTCAASLGYWYVQTLTNDPNYCTDSGTLNPWMPAGSIVFTPRQSIYALSYIHDTYPNFFATYGFLNCFNTGQALNGNIWINASIVGVDNAGPGVISIENYRSGLVWEKFMQIPEIQEAMAAIVFQDINVPDHDDFNDAGETAWHAGFGSWGTGSINYEDIPNVNEWVNGKAVVVQNTPKSTVKARSDFSGGWLGFNEKLYYNDQSLKDTLTFWYRTEPADLSFKVGMKDYKGNEILVDVLQIKTTTTIIDPKQIYCLPGYDWKQVKIPLADFEGVFPTNINNVSFQLPNAQAGKIYVDYVAFIKDDFPISAPQNMAVEIESDLIKISADPVEGAVKYRGYKSTVNGDDYSLIYEGEIPEFSEAVPVETTYYIMTAVNAEAKMSHFSKQVCSNDAK